MPYNIDTNITEQLGPDLIDDITFLAPTGFHLLIDNLKFKNSQFLVQLASLPTISLPPANFSTPLRNLGLHGDKIEYAPFECTFLIDEGLINYKEIHDWILAQVVEDDTKKKTKDMTLSILSSSNNVIKQIQFVDAFPIDLTSIPFDATATDVEYMTASVTFQYSYYKLL
jgi:hypothetical protein|tara:strand:+ start:9967 stop:10476 length:510 start_codon:yes stop_codon:yes gene_type:complete